MARRGGGGLVEWSVPWVKTNVQWHGGYAIVGICASWVVWSVLVGCVEALLSPWLSMFVEKTGERQKIGLGEVARQFLGQNLA